MLAAGSRNLFDRLRPVRRILAPVEALQVRRFGRSLLSTVFRTPVLLLHTTGRRSGQERTTTLACHPTPDGWLVVGGAGGQGRTPDWVANLRSQPRAAVTVGGIRRPVAAVEMTGDERRHVWPELVGVWPRITTYERRAGRPVPVFALRPDEADLSGAD